MAECANAVLLEGSFAIYPKTTTEYRVLVTNSEISYVQHTNDHESSSSKKSVVHVIRFSDVIGADCMRGKTADCRAAYLNIYAYPHRKKFTGSGSLRQRRCVTFVFSEFPSFDENHKDAQRWQLVITHLVRRIEVKLEGIIETAKPTSVLIFCFLKAFYCLSNALDRPSNQFLANVNVSSRSLYAIARPSVVCLSVCLLSVTFVRPTQAVQIFGNISTALGTFAIR